LSGRLAVGGTRKIMPAPRRLSKLRSAGSPGAGWPKRDRFREGGDFVASERQPMPGVGFLGDFGKVLRYAW